MTKLSYLAAEILTYLLELAARDVGFEVRGVRGWASAPVIVQDTGIWGAGGLLKTQVRNGRAIEEDVRAPGETKATHVYRITQRGLDTLAHVAGTRAAAIRAPDACFETRVLLRDGVLSALEVLCLASHAEGGPGREAGQRVWNSSRELTRLLDGAEEAADRPPRWFMSEDLRWLVKHGFAEEHVSGRTHRYRITRAGAALRPLQWSAR